MQRTRMALRFLFLCSRMVVRLVLLALVLALVLASELALALVCMVRDLRRCCCIPLIVNPPLSLINVMICARGTHGLGQRLVFKKLFLSEMVC